LHEPPSTCVILVTALRLKIPLCLLLVLPCLAAEHAVLKSGFRLRAERHEIVEGNVRLYDGDSFVELPAADVTGFEVDDYVAPPQPPPPPAAAPAPILPVDPRELVTRAAVRNGLPPEFLHSVAQVESGYRQDAVSPKGAVGIMQLMPQTARDLQADASDAEQNVNAGARYLRQLLLKYMDDPYQVRKALAAYNAGPAAVDRYGGVPPYSETQRYVRRVLEVRRQLSQ
jgi:soluble lytic murein transglycosylase-like protein